MIDRLSLDAMCELVDSHAEALLLYARQWGDVGAADAVQEAFLQLVRQVQTGTTPENVVPWLYRVVRNELITQYQSRASSRAREQRVAAGRPEWFEPSLDSRLDALRAADQLAVLPMEQREAVVARIWGGLSFEEIAALTQTSRSTAHRRYLSGIEALRKTLMDGKRGCDEP